MRTDRRSHGQTGITKLTVAFRNFVNTSKNVGYDVNRAPVGGPYHKYFFKLKTISVIKAKDNQIKISIILELNTHMTMFSQYSRSSPAHLASGVFRLW